MGKSEHDTIVAQATPLGVKAPLALLRISGPLSWSLVAQFFIPVQKKTPQAWTLQYGNWCDDTGVIDDVIVSFFKKPYSYTGQDMVEISCHGNPVFVDAIQNCVIQAGARRAEPGEFTLRAVLNGKMDLIEAESVHALLESKTRYQADIVRKQAKGPLVNHIRAIVEGILQIQAHLEASIDYGEEDIDAVNQSTIVTKMQRMITTMLDLKETALFSQSLRRGYRVLLTGEPNVGKSTLFNAILKQERSIVTHIPGTTRDMVSEEIELEGLPVVFIDTAGVRETDDHIETLGIEKIYDQLEQCDLILYLTSLTNPQPIYPRLKALPEFRRLTVYTKSDCVATPKPDALCISAEKGTGIHELKQEIVIRLSSALSGHSVYLINKRQEEVVAEVIHILENAVDEYENGFGEEILSSHLNSARRLLGEITGDTTVEDILDRMFSNFCLGK